MPRGATSYNRARFRSQPYGSRSAQSNLHRQQGQANFDNTSANNSEAPPSIVQPVDQVTPEAPSNSTGEHTDELNHVDWQPIPPTDAPIPDVEPLNLPAPTEPGVYHAIWDGTRETWHALYNDLPPGARNLHVTIGEKTDGPDDATVSAGPSEPPRGPRYPRYDSYRPRELRMVNSMALQTISRTNSRAPPSMSIYNNSRGGGVQDNVFTKVPSASKTISFRVDSEETLLQAYRHVKAMNPSDPVGGIMFSVAPKTEKHEFLFTEVNNIRWNALTSRQNSQLPPGVQIFRNRDGGFSINT